MSFRCCDILVSCDDRSRYGRYHIKLAIRIYNYISLLTLYAWVRTYLRTSLQTGRHTDRKSVYTSRVSSVGAQESNVWFLRSDRRPVWKQWIWLFTHDDRFAMPTGRRTVFAYRFANRSSCINAILQSQCKCINIGIASPILARCGLIMSPPWEKNAL